MSSLPLINGSRDLTNDLVNRKCYFYSRLIFGKKEKNEHKFNSHFG